MSREILGIPRRRKNEDITGVDKETRDQYPSSLGFLTRLALYRHTKSYEDFFVGRDVSNPDLKNHLTDVHYREVEAMREAGVNPDATVVSLACGDGSDVLLWAEEYAHTGRIIGVNLDPILDYGEWEAEQKGYGPVPIDDLRLGLPMDKLNEQRLKNGEGASRPLISFLEKDASATGLPDNSVDAVTINNLFHHVHPDNIEKIIREVVRIAKYNAIIAISGRDIMNMHKHWEDISEIAKELGAERYPTTFYNRFGVVETDQIVNRFFTPVPELAYNQNESMQIPASFMGDYLASYYELIPNIQFRHSIPSGESINERVRNNPTRMELAAALEKIVMPRLVEEREKTAAASPDSKGYITDGVSQHFRIGINNMCKTKDGRVKFLT
jgi:ubiquinone/menaquinone biosynthesis C-methylase UbiE